MNVPVSRHIKVTIINIPVGILITNVTHFASSFWSVMKLALIFYTALVDLVATAVVWKKKKILALRSDECSFWYYSKTFPFFVSQFDEIQALTKDSGVSAVRPNFVFEVNYSEANNAKFQDVRKGRELLYAYHGSRLENFHSILHHGLASHMNKVKRCITSTLALLQWQLVSFIN